MIFITISSINVMKKANVSTFRGKQMMIPGLLLIVLMSELSANEIVDRIAISGSKVALSCSFTASHQTVTWEIRNKLDGSFNGVAVCHVNSLLCEANYNIVSNATRSDISSTAFVSRSEQSQEHFRCLLGDVVQQTYNVTFIEKPTISPPNCTIFPTTSHQGRNATLTFSCESYVQPELPYRLTMLGFSENISTIGKSDLHVKHNIDVENFRENLDVVCELRLSVVDISETCSFPHSTNVTNTPGVRDAIFDCLANSSDAVTWRLFDSEGREEDMMGRSWTRNGGRSLLIKNIDEQDLGKLAECRINGFVGFGVIDEIGSSGNELDNNDGIGTHVGYSDRSVYVTLTYVFGGALLITLLIVISHWRCGVCAHPLKWYAQFKPHGKPKTSTMNQPSGSIENNFSERGTNSRSPGGDVVTIAESNLNNGNQNNSALNHPRDPTPQTKATLSSDADASSSVHLDQPVIDTNQHTYFCVERSTPPPSLPDLSTSESMTIYQDPDYEESQRQRLRDSAGYDVVDASKKKVNNNFDMDDYAEVGGAYDMTSNPAIAPRSSKGLIGKGIVMSSDPAVLYGKVNK